VPDRRETIALTAAQPTRLDWRRAVVNGVIIFHLMAIVSWSLPFDIGAKKLIDRLSGPYMRITGLWQGWDMFAPEPMRLRVHVEAQVTRRDGSTVMWKVPDLETLGLFERYQKERYRKWGHDNVRNDSGWRLWEPTAQYIARQFVDPQNPPVRVELRRRWQAIDPPGAQTVADAAAPRWRRHTYYRFAVRPEHLQ
jgi:hypothetical protein